MVDAMLMYWSSGQKMDIHPASYMLFYFRMPFMSML